MHDLVPALAIISLAVVIVCPYIINKIIKFKLEIEKVRVEGEIKKEEIRARNQFDIEKMISYDHKDSTGERYDRKNISPEGDGGLTNRETRRERLRD